MKRYLRYLPVWLGSCLLGLVSFGFVLGATLGRESIYKYLSVFAEVYSLVRGNYVDSVDDSELLQGAYLGMMGGLDPFSGYIAKDQFQAAQRDPVGGPATTGLELLKVPGGATIVAVAPGSPGEKAGLRPGDQVWEVDGVAARNLSLFQLRRSQRGPADSSVRLAVYHPKLSSAEREGHEPAKESPNAGKREDLKLKRTTAGPPALEARVIEGTIGYLRLPTLERVERDPLKAALSSLKQKGATRLVLDLRNCSSGGVEDAVRVAGLFLTPGPVVVLQSRSGARVTKTSTHSAVWTLPVFVLENGGSAGGAETLAAALRARAKAQLLGETSYGLGSNQELVPLPSGDGLVISSTKLIPPGGESWNNQGLKPDKEIPSSFEERLGLEPDNQLEKAIEWLRTPTAQAA